MKTKNTYHINKQIKIILFACLCLLFALTGETQVLPGFPKPKVYYSFNQGTYDFTVDGYKDLYKTDNFAGRSSKAPSPTTDRFNRNVDALFLTSASSTTTNESFSVFSGSLFGMIPAGGLVPPNFTFACWINIPSVTDNTSRMIWSASAFALIYKGHDIFLRRTVKGFLNQGDYLYKFWSPASFDVPGWHEIFLVFGTRASDKLPFVKLYVGKPAYIAYDNNGPRQVPANSSPLAWNFSGGYCFLAQGDLGPISQWHFGNNGESGFKTANIIDDFAVWDVALTENQAKQLFDCQSSANGRDNRCWDSNFIPDISQANLAVSQGSLSPAFERHVKTYNTLVEKQVDRIGVIPTFGVGTKIKVNGMEAPNGSLSRDIPLRMGSNTITVAATGTDTSAAYTINVFRGVTPDGITATNTLSPNGDGKNDTWVIKDIELFPDNTVTIFDKGGHAVFTKHGYNNDWNGTYQGVALAEGTYYYMIDLGTQQPKTKGFITIIRNR